MRISEQVKELRELAIEFNLDDKEELATMFNEAADTIEALSEKLAAVDGGGWIACEDRFPKRAGTYLVTSRIYFVPDHIDEPDNYIGVKITNFSEKFGWNCEEVLAWQPLPEPYRNKPEEIDAYE